MTRARPPAPKNDAWSPLVLVGGTGRSGTHVIANLLDTHPRFYSVPIESRFHAKPRGFPDLLAGRVTKREFVRKLRGFWWRRIAAGETLPWLLPSLPLGRRSLGLYRVVGRERFERAVARFEIDFDEDPAPACRRLFLDLLRPLAEERDKPGLVEMTTDNVIQAETLGELFPEAKFILTIRDGRDTGASKVARRQRSHHPTDAITGVDWWLERMLRVERGLATLPPERVHLISLDDFVTREREPAYQGLIAFLGINDRKRTRAYFEQEMNPQNANRNRWRQGLSRQEQDEVNRHYETALERLEAEGSRCVPLLRRTFELDA